MSEVSKIGFIGLGAMGLPMAKLLLGAGYRVSSAVHKNKQSAEALSSAGGTIAGSFAEAVSGADLIISILPDDAQLKSLYESEEFFDAVPQSALVLEMTSCAPKTMIHVENHYRIKDVKFIDAPVSGGVKGAESGNLTIFCAGDDAIIDSVAPILDVLGKKIFRLKNVGDGKAVKAVNQMIVAVNIATVAEAYSLARSMNLDMEQLYDIISASSGSSYAFINKFKRIADEDFEGGFKFSLMKKDLSIALEEGKDLSLPIAGLTKQLYNMCKDRDNQDCSTVSSIYR